MLPEYIEDLVDEWEPVGSRVTCSPAPTDTDQDILVLISKDNEKMFFDELMTNKWLEDEPERPETPKLDEDDPGYKLAWDKWEAALDAQQEQYRDIGHGGAFESWRKGQYNLIVTMKPEWFASFMAATAECKEQNLLNKVDRIAVFNKHMPKIVPVKKPSKKDLLAKMLQNFTPVSMEVPAPTAKFYTNTFNAASWEQPQWIVKST